MIKRLLIVSVAALSALSSFADDRVKPVYSGSYLPLVEDEVVYLYNIESQQFLTEGNDWGTHASVGNEGMQIKVNKFIPEDGEWDNMTYIISDNSAVKGGWYNMFITDNGNIYADASDAAADRYFCFNDLGGNKYQIYGSPLNPTWNAIGEMEGYMMGHYTDYTNTRDGVWTGTGVVYGYNGVDTDYLPGQFLATWAFVSESDYLAYEEKIQVYLVSEDLKTLIEEATTMGVDASEAQVIYDNMDATADDLNAAIEELYAKILAYYETSVTPDNPKDLTGMIANPTCDAVDGWYNGINATTWNTQTWIDDSWEGMEGTTLNIWGANLSGTVSQTLTGLPNGIYVISLAVYSEKLNGSVYANENTKDVVGTAAGKTYQVTTEVTDGVLEFGFKQEEAGTNWIAIDNASVNYFGSGVEAYRYWLNGLLESAPSFDEVTVQTDLLNEYDGVLKSVNTATTKEEILNIIPAYEDVLNRINTNIEAYKTLADNKSNAEELALLANTYYGEKIGDYILDIVDPIIEAHTLSTDDVNATNSEFNGIIDETQQYVWNMEKVATETATLQSLYDEYSETASLEAAMATFELLTSLESLDTSNYTNADVEKLLQDIYKAEFDIQVPAEPASDDNPVDYTAKIYNPSFNGVDGWTNEGWTTFSNNTWYGFANEEGASSGDGNYLNLWNESDAYGYQKIEGLPAGGYKLTFGAYADNEGFQVSANDEIAEINVGRDGDGNYMRIYTIPVVIGEEGTLEIGVRNTNGGTAWSMVDEMHLTYYGKDSEIVTAIAATTASSSASAIYTVSGVRTANMQKGINIVKMSDGSVKKILK